MLNRSEHPLLQKLSNFEIQPAEKRRLNNGIPLNIINADTEEVVRVDVLIHAGRKDQSYPLQAWFTSLLLREGSIHSTSKEIAEKLDFYGAFIVPSSSVEHSTISLFTLTKYIKETTELLFELLTEATFPATELNRIKEQRRQRFLVDCTKVDYVSQRHFNELVYGPQHPLGKTIQLEQFDALEREQLVSFYEAYYNSQHCSIYVSGCVTDNVLTVIEQFIGSHTWGKQTTKKSYSSVVTPEKQHLSQFYHQPESVQNAIRIGGYVIHQNHADTYALNVLIVLLGGYFGSRLMKNIREDKGYTYGISAGLSYFCKAGVFHISTETAIGNTEEVIKEIYKEIQLLQEEEVSEEELKRVQNYMYGNFCRNYETPFSIADAWIYAEVNRLPSNYIGKSLEAIQQVTPLQIRMLANKYLRIGQLTEVVVGEKEATNC